MTRRRHWGSGPSTDLASSLSASRHRSMLDEGPTTIPARQSRARIHCESNLKLDSLTNEGDQAAAMSRPCMRFVPMKTAEQLAALMLVSLRDRSAGLNGGPIASRTPLADGPERGRGGDGAECPASTATA